MTPKIQEQSKLELNWPALLDATLFGAIGVMLLAKTARGVLTYYIHPRYTVLVIACGIILLAIAALRSLRIWAERPERMDGRGSWYLLLAVPLLLGVIVPAQPLDGALLAVRGADLSSPRVAQASSFRGAARGDSSEWNLLEWTMTLSLEPEQARGKPVDVLGFVFHDPKLGQDGFYVARYVVTCCSADGTGVGLPVVWPGGKGLPENGWVRVRGTLGETQLEGRAEPAIVASAVEPTEQPRNPYLYP
jgi:putative membrane protein